MGFTDYNI